MKLSEISQLLHPEPLHLETGYERFDDGVLHVACRTDMHGCTGEMFEWWFRSRPNTQQYIWWHPRDHISSDWAEQRDGTHVGSIHVVEESIGGHAQKLAIQFREPTELFDAAEYIEARRTKAVSAAICGRVGITHEPPRTEQGEVIGSRVLHIARDTSWGACLRSHFYLGQDLPPLGVSAEDVARLVPDELAGALLQHCYNEMTYLSRFLPSLFMGENRDKLAVPLPW